jgi:hypothetical protein
MSDLITCPRCHAEFELSEAIAGRLRAELADELSADVRAREGKLAKRESELKKERAAIQSKERDIEEQIQARLDEEREALAKSERARLARENAAEKKSLIEELTTVRANLDTAKAAELELRKEKRELEQARADQELEVARAIDKEREAIRARAKKEVVEEVELKQRENDKVIADLRSEIQSLHRKADSKSQQLQGEVLELSLEEQLARLFPGDVIEPVSTGARGGDLLQHVHENGRTCGTILWEAKQTRHWSVGWLPKLRDDQREARADLVALVSVALPEGVVTFERIDDVWVTSRACVAGLAVALRSGLIEVSRTKQSFEGRAAKMDLLYEYLTGPGFRRRAEGITEAFKTMRDDLEREKRAFQKAWARREKEIDRAIVSAAGLWGDIEGLAGRALPHAESFALPDEPGATKLLADSNRHENGEAERDALTLKRANGVLDRNGTCENDAEPDDARARDPEDDVDAEVPTDDAGSAGRIVECLRRSPRPLGRGDTLRRAGIDPGEWTATINGLVSTGRVLREGEKRGARYQLP